MERDFSKEIESRRDQIKAGYARMEQLKIEYIAGIHPFAANWMRTIARQYIERNPERTLKLGLEKLTILKSRITQLCENIEGLTKEIFLNAEFWPETRGLITQNQLGVRILFGKLGIILEEFGFVKTQAQTEGDQESWNQYDGTGNRREFDGTKVYPHSIEIPDAMKGLLEEYRNLILRKDALYAEISHLEFEKLQIEATKMWDSI